MSLELDSSVGSELGNSSQNINNRSNKNITEEKPEKGDDSI